MVSFADIRTAIDALREVQRAIGETNEKQGERWRYELVRLRRDLAERLGAVYRLSERWSPAPEQTPHKEALRRSLSALRTALAEHQALWPAVSVDIQAPEYRQSVGQLRATYAELDETLSRIGAECR